MHPQISQRVFHTPLLATPAKAAAFAKGLGPRLLGVKDVIVEGADGKASKPTNAPFASILDERLSGEIQIGKRNGYAVKDGVAIIPVSGTLIHRGGWIGESSGQTSYEGIGAQFDAAQEDSRVRAIALEVDSYGGEVAGCFSLANRIRESRGKKPIWAFVADHAYSAAYALASQADRVILPRAGGAGSIGVICMHADYSGQLESLGVTITVIAAGEHKADGNPYEPLPDDVREDLEAEMNDLRLIFAETVAAGRGDRLNTQAALDTEAACLLGARAVETGLADEVADPRDAFARFIEEVNGRSDPISTMAIKEKESHEMSKINDKSTSTDAQSEDNSSNDVSQPPQGSAAPQSSETGGDSADAKQQERNRIGEILALPEAQGREDLAKSLAFNSSMSAEEAKVHLEAAAKAQPQQTLSEQMSEDDTNLDGNVPEASSQSNLVQMMRARHG